MSQKVRVLVVDDSTFMRRAIIRMLGTDAMLEVVAQAGDGEEALRVLDAMKIDVVTLDLEMPGLGGLATLERLRARKRVPVVVLSGQAAQSAAVTLQALDLGAFDVVAKPLGGALDIHDVGRVLVAQVRAAAGLDAPSGPLKAPLPARRPQSAHAATEIVLIGTSTGGPPALQKVLPALPRNFPWPVVVLQHMPPGYTKALAERLDRLSALRVKEAENGDRLQAGVILVAPSGRQLAFVRGADGPTVAVLDAAASPSYYHPSIDFTLSSAARAFGAGVLGVILTGMGSDGAEGLCRVKEAGGIGWAQDEATSVIYGMPRAALEAGAVEVVFPLDELAARLSAIAGRLSTAGG